MNPVVRRKILTSPWEPKSYNAQELASLLTIPIPQATGIIKDINGGSNGFPCLPWVTHHDLIPYLKDTTTITEVPTNPEQVSPHGRWLIEERGWGLDLTKKCHRWIDPRDPVRRLSLSNALKIELARTRIEEHPEEFKPQPQDSPPEGEPDFIEAEFQIKTTNETQPSPSESQG